MPGDGSGRNITIRMPDEGSLQTVKTILAYEATVRGRKPGQALTELVMEAVDIDSYPPEVRARLDELAERVKDTTPEWAEKIDIFMPDEKARRLGQSVAAAQIPAKIFLRM